MPDFMDAVQEREQQSRDIALASIKPASNGLPFCETCDAAISPLRQGLGARLCLQHQQELEDAMRRRR
jgi:RNA polymerase-binding transcription factor DksA